jgi:hypothetical protein
MEQMQSHNLTIWQIALAISVSEKAMNRYEGKAMTARPEVCQFVTSLFYGSQIRCVIASISGESMGFLPLMSGFSRHCSC